MDSSFYTLIEYLTWGPHLLQFGKWCKFFVLLNIAVVNIPFANLSSSCFSIEKLAVRGLPFTMWQSISWSFFVLKSKTIAIGNIFKSICIYILWQFVVIVISFIIIITIDVWSHWLFRLWGCKLNMVKSVCSARDLGWGSLGDWGIGSKKDSGNKDLGCGYKQRILIRWVWLLYAIFKYLSKWYFGFGSCIPLCIGREIILMLVLIWFNCSQFYFIKLGINLQ